MTKNNTHSAEGPSAGYIFQFERALFWLSMGEENATVRIEAEDDVVYESLTEDDEVRINLEQDKHTLKSKTPFTDKSIDLWKTLSIWVDKIIEDKVNGVETDYYFLFVTNKVVPSSRLVKKIAKSCTEKEVNEILDDIKKTAASTRKTVYEFSKKIEKCDDDILKKIIKNSELIDGKFTNPANHKKKIKSNLSVPSKLPFNQIYDELIGWVINTCIDCWRENKQAEIKVRDFNNLYGRLCQKYFDRPFIEKAQSSLPIKKTTAQKHKNSVFCKQLKLIELEEEDELLSAIEDFMRAKKERIRFARQGNVTESDFIEFDESLYDFWKLEFRTNNRLSKSSPSDTGYKTYSQCMKNKDSLLAGYKISNGYLIRGSYQIKSNNKELGWHPDWKKLTNEDE